MSNLKHKCYFVGENVHVRKCVNQAVSQLGLELSPLYVDAIPSLRDTLKGCIAIDVDSSPQVLAEFVTACLDQFCWMPIIAITERGARRHLMRLHQSGASDVVFMPQDYATLSNRVIAALHRDASGSTAPSLLRRKFATLTEREREIIRFFLDGQNAKSVAKNLNITFQTVDKHRNRSLRKIGVKSLVELQNRIQLATLVCLGINLRNRAPQADRTDVVPVPPIPHLPSIGSMSYHY